MSLGIPRGEYQLFADDDDVIGCTVARTYPQGWAIVRIGPPLMDAFDEFAVGQFLTRCLGDVDDVCSRMGWERPE